MNLRALLREIHLEGGTRVIPCLGLLLFALVAAGTQSVQGADLSRQPTQLSVRHWTKKDGLPAEFIWSVHQSESGFLWIATDIGIARFDGLQFQTYSSATHDAFRSNDIREIAEGPGDTIWAASVGGGLLRLRSQEVTRFDHDNGLASDAVYSVLVAENGDVWAGTTNGACRLREASFRCWTGTEGLVGGRIVRLAEDPQNRIWFASITEGVSVLDGERLQSFGAQQGFADGGVTVLVSHPKHNMLIGTLAGTYYSGTTQGLDPLAEFSLPAELKPFNALRDREGNMLMALLAASGSWNPGSGDWMIPKTILATSQI